MAESQPHALFEQVGRVGLITLNRPERLNALSGQLTSLLVQHVVACNENPGIGAIVITGAGRGFCSGADMSSLDPTPAPAAGGRAYEGSPVPELFTNSKPIIAAINGPAIGAGLTLTLGCDIRLASERATFSARFVRVGSTPEFASTYFLPQVVGLPNALELVLTARIIDAETALGMGLVSRVLPHDDLVPEAMALAAEIADNPMMQVRAAKRLLHANAVNNNVRAVILAEEGVRTTARQSDDAKEARAAFAEKRPPVFNQPR
jgi:2-(1,2-epoxy-1,2-dihydrophenyl)acetyl-CoA isomerase